MDNALYLFNLDLMFQKDLELGEIPDYLRSLLEAEWVALSQKVIIGKTNDRWIIYDKKKRQTYHIIKKQGVLEVYFIYHVPSSETKRNWFIWLALNPVMFVAIGLIFFFVLAGEYKKILLILVPIWILCLLLVWIIVMDSVKWLSKWEETANQLFPINQAFFHMKFGFSFLFISFTSIAWITALVSKKTEVAIPLASLFSIGSYYLINYWNFKKHIFYCMNCEKLQAKYSVKEEKDLYLNEAKACSCGNLPDTQVWFFYTTPEYTWLQRRGIAGWMTFCTKCNKFVNFFMAIIT